jgi:hypothetical protein
VTCKFLKLVGMLFKAVHAPPSQLIYLFYLFFPVFLAFPLFFGFGGVFLWGLFRFSCRFVGLECLQGRFGCLLGAITVFGFWASWGFWVLLGVYLGLFLYLGFGLHEGFGCCWVFIGGFFCIWDLGFLRVLGVVGCLSRAFIVFEFWA